MTPQELTLIIKDLSNNFTYDFFDFMRSEVVLYGVDIRQRVALTDFKVGNCMDIGSKKHLAQGKQRGITEQLHKTRYSLAFDL